MNTNVRLTCALLLLGLAVPLRAQGQTISENLQELAQDNAELYVQPVFHGLGNAMGVGFLRTPDVHDQLGFDIGVRAVGALIPDEAKMFAPALPSEVTVDGSEFPDDMERTFVDPYTTAGGELTPTAAGEGPGVTLVPDQAFADSLQAYGLDEEQFEIPFPDGFDVPGVPLAVIQGGVGIGGGTEISARLLPSTEVDEDVGDIAALGFTVTHQVDRWLPGPSPVDVSIFGGYQNVTVGSYLDASTTSFGASVGKGLGPLSVYGVGQLESPSVDLEYEVSNPDGHPALPADGTVVAFSPAMGSSTRFGAGVQFDLLILQLAAEYSVGDYDALTGRVSLSFR